MKQRFTEEQIIKILTRLGHGEKAKDLSREFGVTQATLYVWKKKFGNMTVNEAKRLRALEAENAKLKAIVADLTLDIKILKDVNSRKW